MTARSESPGKPASARSTWSRERHRDRGSGGPVGANPLGGSPTISAPEAFAQLGIDRTTGYRAIKEGTFPLPVIRVGRAIRVSSAALCRLLDGDAQRYDHLDVRSEP
jgi:predicted DNA-binding transcriptional regulator AlpA